MQPELRHGQWQCKIDRYIEEYFQGRRDKIWFLGVKDKGRRTEK